MHDISIETIMKMTFMIMLTEITCLTASGQTIGEDLPNEQYLKNNNLFIGRLAILTCTGKRWVRPK